MYFRFQELEKNETLHDEEEAEEGLKKTAEGEVEEDGETDDEDEYDEMELEEVWIPLIFLFVRKVNKMHYCCM